MKWTYLIFGLAFSISISLNGQKAVPTDKSSLEGLLSQSNDTTYVINFWATWCAPCIEELEYFEKLNETYRQDKIKIVMISLDFPNKISSRLLPFLKDRDIRNQVRYMTDLDYNSWIPLVDSVWDGAIPVTLFYNKDEKYFVDSEISEEKLFEITERLLIK